MYTLANKTALNRRKQKTTMEQNTILDKIKVPTFLCVELNLFGGTRAFQLLKAFCDYGFKGVEPQKEIWTRNKQSTTRTFAPHHRQAKGRAAQKGKTKGKKKKTTTNKYKHRKHRKHMEVKNKTFVCSYCRASQGRYTILANKMRL